MIPSSGFLALGRLLLQKAVVFLQPRGTGTDLAGECVGPIEGPGEGAEVFQISDDLRN